LESTNRARVKTKEVSRLSMVITGNKLWGYLQNQENDGVTQECGFRQVQISCVQCFLLMNKSTVNRSRLQYACVLVVSPVRLIYPDMEIYL
jgi:hypothetical protein